MATHTLAMLVVSMLVIQKLNSILSTFFWGKNNGQCKWKWGAWKKLCKLVEKGGVGMIDTGDIKRSLHMKFASSPLEG